MAYNEETLARIRDQMAAVPALKEKKMFGGVAFLVHGNMSVGINGDDLMVRASPDDFDDLIARPGARPMDFTGRPMKGWITVEPLGFADDQALAGWIDASLEYVLTLPPK